MRSRWSGAFGVSMKRFLSQSVLLASGTAVALFLCVLGQAYYHWLGWSTGWRFLLLWPAIVLSRWGVDFSWIALVLGGMGLIVGLAWAFRTRSLLIAPCAAVILASGYCVLGRLVFAQLEVPLPRITPYESDELRRVEYVQTWEAGYRYGLGGVFRTYCFMPEHKTRGFYEGLAQGSQYSDRVLGEDHRYKIETAAGRDGVDLVLETTSPEPKADTNLPPIGNPR